MKLAYQFINPFKNLKEKHRLIFLYAYECPEVLLKIREMEEINYTHVGSKDL